MRSRYVRLAVVVGIALVASVCAGARPASADAPVRVVTKEIEPFVIIEDDQLSGFSVDLWEEAAALAGIEYEWIVVDSVAEQLEAVQSGSADVAVAAISMTSEREELVDFTHPYFRSGLRIMARSTESHAFSELLTVLLAPRLLALYASVVALLVAMGFAVWLVERRRNDHFPDQLLPGVWEGVWWAAATLTTVGYGDRTVVGKRGRVIGLLWMFAGLFLLANFTAVIATELTVARKANVTVSGVEDLSSSRVATVDGTTSAEFLVAEGIRFRGVDSIDEAVTLLSDGQLDAVVFDGPVLQYHQARIGDPTLAIVGEPFQREDYAMAMAYGSPRRQALNIALLELWEDGTHAGLLKKWSITDR